MSGDPFADILGLAPGPVQPTPGPNAQPAIAPSANNNPGAGWQAMGEQGAQNYIVHRESRGDYDAVHYGPNVQYRLKPPAPPSSMTLGQVYDFQRQLLKVPGNDNSSATGAHQWVSGTLKSVGQHMFGDGWRDQPFNADTQNAMFNHVYGQGPAAMTQAWGPAPGNAGSNTPADSTGAVSSETGPDANDPYWQALNGATGQGHDGVPVNVASGSPQGAGPDNSQPAVRNGAYNNPGHQGGTSPQPTSFGQNVSDILVNTLGGAEHVGSQAIHFADNLPGIGLVQKGETAAYNWLTGNKQGTANPAERGLEWLSNNARQSSYDPNSWYSWGGRLGGEVLATLPFAEAKIAEAPEGASMLARALASSKNGVLQGGIVGGLTGETGHDARNIALGALTGGLISPLATEILTPGVDALKNAVFSAWNKTMGASAPAATSAVKAVANAMPDSVKQAIDGMVSKGASTDEIAKAFPEWINSKNASQVQAWINWRKAGHMDGMTFKDTPAAPADSTVTASNLNAAGSRRGIESTTQLPADVQQHVDSLVAQGVPTHQALAEASVKYVGGNPTVGQVTRDFSQQQAESAAGKLPTREGQALAATDAANNAALHSTVQDTVDGLGGTPGKGDAAQTAATALKRASDSEYAKVSRLYDQADAEAATQKAATDAANSKAMADWHVAANDARIAASRADQAKLASGEKLIGSPATEPELPPKPMPQVGPGYIPTPKLQAALESPEFQNPTIEGGKTLRSGVLGLLKSYSQDGTVTLKQAESLRQAINDAYDNAGGSINGKVGELKAALDADLSAYKGGNLYQQARTAYAQWATRYDNPAGVADLIRADAKGNLLKDDSWETATNRLLGNEQGFIQVVRQLRANGDIDTLNKLKAEVVQRGYDAATGKRSMTAADQGGNPIFNASKWEGELNGIGMSKINALFSKDEIAHLAAIGRAARVLQNIPGTVNASNTASHGPLTQALLDAAQNPVAEKGANRAIWAAEMGGHLVSLPLHATGAGGIAANTALGLAGAAARQSAKDAAMAAAKKQASGALAEALRKSMNPSAARSAANDQALSLEQMKARKMLADELARYGVVGSVSATDGNGRR